MTIELEYVEAGVFVDYAPRNGTGWIKELLERSSQITLCKIFNITQSDIDAGNGFYEDFGEERIHFKIGDCENGLYVIRPPVLSDEYTLSIRPGSELDFSYFKDCYLPDAMDVVFEILKRDITIGNKDGDLSPELLRSAMEKYPGITEYQHYKRLRAAEILGAELELPKDYRSAFDKYVEKRRKGKKMKDLPDIHALDLQKFTFLYKEMKDMLDNPERYDEADWQERIMEIVKLLYPQYIYVTRESKITEMYGKGTRVDFVVINSSGYIDIIEIKDPKVDILATYNGHLVRDRNNYVPSRYLGNTVAQVENYIFGLNKDNKKAIENIRKHFSNSGTSLPDTLSLKIVNPRGLIIMGRSNTEDEEISNSIELLRRQYSHIVDIVTYDDLIGRLHNIMNSLK
ncbi:MAG: DUF4263 domain-containing protein [Candidatus Methanomethylophilaceae archaeon]|nr:DUF4263 domain-containing protein [Candidatus Methanomethylophilaceae archaeon]